MDPKKAPGQSNDPAQKPKNTRFALRLTLSLIVFAFLIITMVIISVTIGVLVSQGVLVYGQQNVDYANIILFMAIGSIVIGTLLAAVIGRFPLQPLNQMIDALNKLASGDFRARIKTRSRIPYVQELAIAFNKLADELEHTEMLRSDFVNNFSHEFKTPIVSIVGFAGLLKEGDLTEEQKREYIDIIERESRRLADMATNVLSLTKIENQAILSDKTSYNLSEQIRSCILLLEQKWSKKRIEFSLEFDEYNIHASEELTKQIWINLIDNAIKFSPVGGVIGIDITRYGRVLSVSISNTGPEIPPEKIDLIFNKFYQADESHSAEGNGVGLAVVKKITELHNGSVNVNCSGGITTFTVELPQR